MNDDASMKFPPTVWSAGILGLLGLAICGPGAASTEGVEFVRNVVAAVLCVVALGGLMYYDDNPRIRSVFALLAHVTAAMAFAFSGVLAYAENQMVFIVISGFLIASVLEFLRTWDFAFISR